MKYILKSCMYLFILTPVIVSIDPESKDSSVTTFQVVGGRGSYAHITRGCEGNVISTERVPFREMGISVDHKFKGTPLRLGARYHLFSHTLKEGEYVSATGYYREVKRKDAYIRSSLALDSRYIGLGFGRSYFIHPRGKEDYTDYFNIEESPYGGYLRIGNIDRLNFKISVNDELVYSNGGMVSLYINTCSKLRKDRFRVGFNAGPPYDGNGLILGLDILLKNNLRLETSGRLGSSEGVSECAISMGLKYQLIGR